MEREEVVQRHAQILNHLAHLPRKMISLHGDGNVTAFVLYDLCHEDCFNFKRAAYFVDNPDFDWLQGVVGCARHEMPQEEDDAWSHVEQFGLHFAQAPFNQRVKEIARSSCVRQQTSEKDVVRDLADALALENYDYCSWNMKHDNYGLLLFEKADHDDPTPEEHIVDGASLLSFCPIF